MQDEIKGIVREAVAFAEDGTEPDSATELASDVYANPQPRLSPSDEYRHGVKNPLL